MQFQKSKFPQINRLREALTKLDPGGSGLKSMASHKVMNRAFFPGGNGLAMGEDAKEFPTAGTIVFGTNFGCESKFCSTSGQLLCLDETSNPGVWQGLRRLLDPETIEKTFFTNAWPFLHVGDSNNVADKEKKSWLADSRLTASCIHFLHLELEELRPVRIIALGPAVAAFLSLAFPMDLKPWRGNAIKAMDDLAFATVYSGGRSIVCVAVTHPAYSHINAPKRISANRDEKALIEKSLVGA